jgi:hypothetical protein
MKCRSCVRGDTASGLGMALHHQRTTGETAAGPVVTGFAGATLVAELDVTPSEHSVG